MNLPCILIPIVVGLICGILGYLLGKMNADDDSTISLKTHLNECNKNTKKLDAKIATLEADLKAKTSINATKQSFTSTAPSFIFDSLSFTRVYGKTIKENDLKIIEGIGPKIESLFNAAGITTWKHLSQLSIEKMQAVLDTGGENFTIHNPGTWAKQALLAYEGKWKKLKEWQDNLTGGKE
ncbi:hypothetical protein [Flavobacterium sp.]|uniref:hypothetical protein n=1 Tax=Flavobacterium sp. TaxID=239 RepID=UPI00374CBACA